MNKNLFVILLFLSFLINIAKADEITVLAVGDIMLGRHIAKDMAKKNKGYTHPYKMIKDTVSAMDIAFANLECPISNTGTPVQKKYCFYSSTKAIQGLLYAGFDVLSIANNHIMDYGEEALKNTIDELKKSTISAIGAGINLAESRKSAIFISSTTKIAFLAYDCTYRWTFASDNNSGTTPGRIKIIMEDIEQAKKQSDIIIVSFHWGNEYDGKTSKFQKDLAHKTIDAGADIIVGHHAHVIQGIEFYKNKPIVYGLGNFIFDQAFGNTRKGIAVKFVIKDKKIEELVCIPISRTYDTYYPVIVQGKFQEEIKSKVIELSKKLNDQKNMKLIKFE